MAVVDTILPSLTAVAYSVARERSLVAKLRNQRAWVCYYVRLAYANWAAGHQPDQGVFPGRVGRQRHLDARKRGLHMRQAHAAHPPGDNQRVYPWVPLKHNERAAVRSPNGDRSTGGQKFIRAFPNAKNVRAGLP